MEFDIVLSKLSNTQIPIYELLSKLINDEWIAYHQYYLSFHLADDSNVKKEFLQHSNEEKNHINLLIGISKDLGIFNQSLNYLILPSINSFHNCSEKFPISITDINLLQSNIDSELCAVSFYSEFLKCSISDKYLKTIEKIIKEEQEHIDDLNKLLKKF